MLQSIEHQSGLPIAFDPVSGSIHWSEGIAADEPQVRSFSEMREQIREPEAVPPRDAIYTVYRHVARKEDAPAIREARLRYDITIIPAGCFQGTRREFVRTAGHYHTVPPSGIAYPEVYEVISGRAHWLIQRSARPARLPDGQAGGPETENPAALEAVYLIEAGPGEKALIPPGFGHISINAGTDPLVMANWISDACTYDYEPFRKFRGGGYWILEGETPGTVEFEQNPGYTAVPELKKLHPKEISEFGLVRSRPLYSLAQELERLAFLNDPEPFLESLDIDRGYRRVV
ncbi:MAG: glucose-6-phosphate isomerase family protein [bacterium]|nr:glucose-6-phosphate isomerase family protein [bacterium]